MCEDRFDDCDDLEELEDCDFDAMFEDGEGFDEIDGYADLEDQLDFLLNLE